jgi:tight adherence protein B
LATPALIALAVFVAVAAIVFIGGALVDQRSAQARLLRERLTEAQKAETQPPENLALLRDEMLSKIPALDSILRRSGSVSNMQTMLAQAGVSWRAGNFLFVSALFAVVIAFLGYSFTGLPAVAALAFVVGIILPYSYASRLRSKRFQRFEEVFPNAVDTLARAVRAGHAFTTSLELISKEVPEPVAGEFRQLFEEQKYGLPVREALLNLTERMPLVDVKFFVTAVMLQRETGGNLAEILDNLSYMIRERFKIMRQVRVHTAQGRMTMMLLMMLPPAIIVTMLTMNASFIQPLFTDPLGHVLLAAGIALQTVGYFVIRRIIRIQV